MSIHRNSFLVKSLIIGFLLFFSSCDTKKSDDSNRSYVKPSVDYKGKTRKGHVRKKVSTDKNAIKNRNRSKYYYETRGKYRRKKG